MGTAIFYDIENVRLTTDTNAITNIEAILAQISTSPLVDNIVLQRAYAMLANQKDEKLLEVLKEKNIEMVDVQAQAQAAKKPNQVDLKMYVDVMAAILRKRSITTVVLVTGDGDFRFLLEELRLHNKKVLLVSSGSITSQSLLYLCDDWIDLNSRTIPSKLIVSICCEHLQEKDYREQDFLLALRQIASDMANDLLLARFIRCRHIGIVTLQSIMERFTKIPDFRRMGYKLWSDLVVHALYGTDFYLGYDAERNYMYLAKKQTPEEDSPEAVENVRISAPYVPMDMYKNIIGYEDYYSPKRMRAWIKKLSRHSSTQLSELFYYLEFMKKNDLIRQKKDGTYVLPTEEGFSEKIITRLKKEMDIMRCPPQKETIEELQDLL